MRDEHTDALTHQDRTQLRPTCERGEDLVALLYGEADERAAESFRQHLTSCASCREEAEAFGGVREAIGVWREEVFRLSPSLSEALKGSPSHSFGATADASPRPARKRSAAAALRAFFDLSPLWLRAAGFAAAVAFCALTALTLARAEVRWDAQGFALRTVRERVVREPAHAPAGPAREELDALAAENQSMKAELESLRSRPAVVAASATQGDEQPQPRRAADTHARANHTRHDARPTRQRRERSSQLARFEDEDNLPRLSDLLDEVN